MGINTLRPGQDGRHFPDDIFKCIFLNENDRIPIQISLKFVPKGPINGLYIHGLSPGRHQAIIRPDAGILLILALRTNFSDT